MQTKEDILDFAISEEIKAAKFYEELAEKVDKEWIRDLLLSFAREEMGHKALLENMKTRGFSPEVQKKVQDLKISDYLVEAEPKPDMDYQDALIIAAKAEKAAFKMYTDLAARMDDPELKALLEKLASEEATHKLRFELEYDDNVLIEN